MSMDKIWYTAINGQTQGPVTEEELGRQIRGGQLNAQSYVFRQGMSDWAILGQLPELQPYLLPPAVDPAPDGDAQPAAPAAEPQPAAPAADPAAGVPDATNLPTYAPPGQKCHEIDYHVHGDDMQFVDIILDPNETVIAEAGAMMYMTSGIQMETRFSDGSNAQRGFMGKLMDAGKRVITGESLFITMFTNQGQGRQTVAFGAPYPGKIIAVDLKEHGGTLICQKDAFLCAAFGTAVGIAFNKKIGAGFFGGEGFILQRLDGDGKAFVHACGTIIKKELEPGETLRVDTGCLVALEQTVNYDIQFVGNVKTAIFGGEGLFFATLTGPGKVYLQSLPFSRLADRIYTHAPSAGGSRKGEGSILGGIGNLLDGD
jgi:uncharacterized protein (TIGR00266 family)